MVDSFGEALEYDGERYATIVIVGNKKSHWKGCLVSILITKGCGAGVCAHEALHYAAYLSKQFGIPLGSFDKSEPLAYLEQWATNCIWCTLVGHPERMNGIELSLK